MYSNTNPLGILEWSLPKAEIKPVPTGRMHILGS
jgi:hypothetical protein